MSVDTTLIKRHNHRVHPCDRNRKLELLKHLVALHADKEILVLSALDIAPLEEQLDADNVTCKSDSELLENPKVKCDMVVSLDLAETPEKYVKRLNQAKTYALLLADDADQKELYKIETLMKRTLTKEIIAGFEPASHVKDREAAKELKERQEYNKKNQEERDEKRQRAENKKRKASKYLGKDENGKALFSGKSGERNHRYDGTPRNEEEKRERGEYRAKKRGEKKPWEKKEGAKARNNDDKQNKTASKRPPRVIKIPASKQGKEG